MTRVIDVGAINFDRAMPLPLMATIETSWGHDGAQLVGVIEEGTSAAGVVSLSGRFDTSDFAVGIARRVADGMLTRHSPDLGSDKTEFECTEYEEDIWGDWCVAGTLRFTEATLLGTTIVPFPASDSATIEVVATETGEDGEPVVSVAASADSLIAAASKVRKTVFAPSKIKTFAAGKKLPAFPAEAFADPKFTEPTSPYITADGWYRGHAAAWESCHIGFPEGPDVCTSPPRNFTGYKYFHSSSPVQLDNGEKIRCGFVTLSTGHADGWSNPKDTTAHYDNTGTIAALVRAGEDEFGIWVAGMVKPGLSDEDLWALQLTPVSGDWRGIEGNLEMLAVLCVVHEGFRIPNMRSVTASGECVSLVAAGARTMSRINELQLPTEYRNRRRDALGERMRQTQLSSLRRRMRRV